MLLSGTNQPAHLTYCLNIHPGESWAENLEAIRTHALAVRRDLAVTAPFGLGLRLGHRAATELLAGAALAEFEAFLEANGLYVFTVNAFPYGQFHGIRVKEQVYAPDWRAPERVAYTVAVAQILARLLPPGIPGSISTVPGSYRAWIGGPADEDAVLAGLGRAALALAEIADRTGRGIVLALEPEPDCLWDSTDGMVELFRRVRDPVTLESVAKMTGTDAARLGAAFANHLGVCVDTCHLAVGFEDPADAIKSLIANGIRIGKVQVSAAPAGQITAVNLAALEGLRDPVYLHQTRIRHADGHLTTYPDLPEAISGVRQHGTDGEIRTHFHIPLSVAGWGDLISTRQQLGRAFFSLLREGSTPHIELETYTFSVLPAELRGRGVVASLVAEFQWFLDMWRQAAPAKPH